MSSPITPGNIPCSACAWRRSAATWLQSLPRRRCGREFCGWPTCGRNSRISPLLRSDQTTTKPTRSKMSRRSSGCVHGLCLRTAPATSPTQAIAASLPRIALLRPQGSRRVHRCAGRAAFPGRHTATTTTSGLRAIAKLMDPTHRPFAAENSVIDTDFVDRRDEVCLMIAQRHRFALTLCCASSGSPRPA